MTENGLWVEALNQRATIDLSKAVSIETVGPGWYSPEGQHDDYVLIANYGQGLWYSVARGDATVMEAERERLASVLRSA